MLWVDKYRPDELDALDYHPQITKRLQNLSLSDDFPHLLVYGPSGAGKKTRIMALLHAMYGKGVRKVSAKVRMLTRTQTIVAATFRAQILQGQTI